MLETDVVEEVVAAGNDGFNGGSGARRNGNVVGRLIFVSVSDMLVAIDDVGEVISDVDVDEEDEEDDDNEELIDVLSNFSLSSRILLLLSALERGLRGVF